MAKARQMATLGPKVADKPKDSGLMVDFYLKGAVDFVVPPAGRACPVFSRANTLVQFEATWM